MDQTPTATQVTPATCINAAKYSPSLILSYKSNNPLNTRGMKLQLKSLPPKPKSSPSMTSLLNSIPAIFTTNNVKPPLKDKIAKPEKLPTSSLARPSHLDTKMSMPPQGRGKAAGRSSASKKKMTKETSPRSKPKRLSSLLQLKPSRSATSLPTRHR
jgi:hypothetical protein